MIMVKIGFDEDLIARTEEQLADIEYGAERAICRALNRTCVGARAEIVRAIYGGYFVHARDVRQAISIKRATYSDLSAEVRSEGAVIELFKFRHSPIKRLNPEPRVGVKVYVKRGGGGAAVPGTFIATVGGHPGIFKRLTEARDSKLERLYGPAIPSMMKTVLDDDSEQGIQDRAEARMVRELEHKVDFLLTGGAR